MKTSMFAGSVLSTGPLVPGSFHGRGYTPFPLHERPGDLRAQMGPIRWGVFKPSFPDCQLRLADKLEQ